MSLSISNHCASVFHQLSLAKCQFAQTYCHSRTICGMRIKILHQTFQYSPAIFLLLLLLLLSTQARLVMPLIECSTQCHVESQERKKTTIDMLSGDEMSLIRYMYIHIEMDRQIYRENRHTCATILFFRCPSFA